MVGWYPVHLKGTNCGERNSSLQGKAVKNGLMLQQFSRKDY
jgi:hypothetical protein